MRQTWLFFSLPMLLAAAPATADQSLKTSTVSASYSLAFWDIPFGHMQYSGVLRGGSYSTRAHFETQGLIGFFWRSIIDATALGNIEPHGVEPQIYDSYSRYRDHPLQRVTLTFTNDDPIVFTDPPVNISKHPVPEEQRKDTVDPMSALTAVLVGAKADKDSPCGTGAQVFDGRRRYDIRLTYLKDEPVTLDNGQERASAHLCQLSFIPIAGYPQKIVAHRHPPRMFADFVDLPDAAAPNGRYVVPVKLWSELNLGTVVATLQTISLDGAAPAELAASKGTNGVRPM
ncbi:MAG: DUF3108 domain-containing protein [Rhizomicrobium sp.]